MFVEKEERERKKNNVLIFGVKQSSQDANKASKQVDDIFNQIGIEPSVFHIQGGLDKSMRVNQRLFLCVYQRVWISIKLLQQQKN